MARIRTIKPEFFTSEDIVELDPLARLLYIALWCEADKEGRLQWKPKTFKMRYFPGDSCDIDALCDALVTRRLVCLYGDGLAYIPSFKDHQHINPRETDSKLPDPDEYVSRDSDASVTREARDSDAQGGREGKGRERNTRQSATRQKPETTIPDDFEISDSVREWASQHGHDRLDQHLACFVDACKAKGYKYRDWDAAFRNAVAKNWARLPVAAKSEPAADPKELVTLPDGQTMTRGVLDFMKKVTA